jgi:hypothetical protein
MKPSATFREQHWRTRICERCAGIRGVDLVPGAGAAAVDWAPSHTRCKCPEARTVSARRWWIPAHRQVRDALLVRALGLRDRQTPGARAAARDAFRWWRKERARIWLGVRLRADQPIPGGTFA